MSRIPAPRQPRHGDGRWETVIRYALGSNARTFRFCAILLAAAVAYHATGLNVIELLRHMLLPYVLTSRFPAARLGLCKALWACLPACLL